MQDAIEGLVDHVVGTAYPDIPEPVLAAARTFILDTIGVGIAGSTGPYVDALLRSFAGTGPARVLGQAASLSAADAALLNGYQIHISEFDCVHESAVIHTMTVLLASMLAEADQRGEISGQTLLRASVLGVDVACNLGVACSTGLRFFRPATAGTFAAVAAVGIARNFDRDTLLRAFALAYTQLCGTMQAHTEGSPLLALQIGASARNALAACDMAEAGLPGLNGVLEGPFGYFGLFEAEGDIRSLLPSLGTIWRITEVAHKPFPSGRATHGIIDAILDIRTRHDCPVRDVARVEARIPQLTNHLIGRPVRDDMEINYARLNGQYAAAVTLLNGAVGIEDFTINAIREPDRIALARKVVIAVDGNPDPNALSPVEVEIHFNDGARVSSRIETVYGNPDKPMTREAHLQKFRDNWNAAVCRLPAAAAEHVIGQVDRLETVPDIRALTDLATG